MSGVEAHFIAEARKYLSESYLPKIERCLGTLDDEDVWWRANEGSNSVSNPLLHLSSSTRMWVTNVVGNGAVEHNRQQEFDERKQIPGRELMAHLRQTVVDADRVLERLDPNSLLQRRGSSWVK